MRVVSALWRKQDRNGKTYYTGPMGGLQVFVFPITKKEKQEQPDARIVLAQLERCVSAGPRVGRGHRCRVAGRFSRRGRHGGCLMSKPGRSSKRIFLLGALLVLAGIAPMGRAATGPSQRWVRLRVNGRDRLALVHLPPAYNGTQALPLVLALHGEGANAELAQRMTALSARADKGGFIVAYPNGTGTARRRGLMWNAGSCCGYAQDHQVDDVAFLRSLIDYLQTSLKVDPHRVYATGFGSGGMMAYRLACQLSDKVAAVAVVGGALVGPCDPAQPVSVLVIHGTDDAVVPYQGGKPQKKIDAHDRTYPSVADAVAFWVKHNGCQTTPRRTEQGKVVVQTYSGGKSDTEVSLVTLQGGGHVWPAGAAPEFSATSALLDFFTTHPKR